MRVVGVTLLFSLLLAATVPAREPTKQELLLAIEKQLRATNEVAGPSVVCVVVSRSDRYPKPATGREHPGKLGSYDIKEFLKANPTEGRLAASLDLSRPINIADHGFACGVIIDASGLVLLPFHVVEGATKIYVHLPGRTGCYADIHAADGRHDLAVLKLINPPQGLTPITFADVRLRNSEGQRATVFNGKLAVLMANTYVTGFPIDKPSASLGSVTGVQSRLGISPADGNKKLDSYYYFGPFIAHDAKLNANVDGAALLNLDGEMLGLMTSTLTSGGDRGPLYAFPADDTFRRVVEVLRRGEEVEYGYLAVQLNDAAGILISGVTRLGPAGLAGVEVGDVVTHVNGVAVNSYDDLLLHIGSALADSKVKLTLLRDRRSRDVTVTLGKLKHTQPSIASVRPEPVHGLRVDYGIILAQTPPMDPASLINGVPAGVSVREIVPNSPAAVTFKKLGDRPERWLITHVNGNAVSTPAEFYKAAKGQQTVKLTVHDPKEVRPRDHEVTLP